MSICKKCAVAADSNREIFEMGGNPRRKHPKDCGCPCQHREITDWDDYFSVPRPNEKDE